MRSGTVELQVGNRLHSQGNSTMKRTASMELKAVREQLGGSPPPPPHGTGVREWFAGLAISNPILMKDVPHAERAKEAVRLADELMAALATPRMPTLESLAPPSDAEMSVWEKKITDDKESLARINRDTVPHGMKAKSKTPTIKDISRVNGLSLSTPFSPVSMFPQALISTDPPPVVVRRGDLPAPTRYSLTQDTQGDDISVTKKQ